MKRAVLIQLPFPSTAAPHAAIAQYYKIYADIFGAEIPGYFIPEGDLWELPLWVAHLSGILREIGWDDRFVDLSKTPTSPELCVDSILEQTSPDDWLLFSPLAQNLALTLDVSRALIERGRRSVIGGNMAGLAAEDDATRIIRGIIAPETFVSAIEGSMTRAELQAQRRGIISWVPRYDLLSSFGKRVPMLRLNASHGCLYSCTFCGDNWSRKLHVVERDALVKEMDQLSAMFPKTQLIYIGDKTFGQSPTAVQNLLDVFADYPGYRFVVQTHVAAVDEALVASMQALGVAIVELGFESADADALRRVGKIVDGKRQIQNALELLDRAGLRIVLNVLGGLPEETCASHAKTISFIEEHRDIIWLYNLYNFVPYPLTPLFPRLRPRIFDWTYSHWREDAPPVFAPYHMSAEQSWDCFLEKITAAHSAILGGAP